MFESEIYSIKVPQLASKSTWKNKFYDWWFETKVYDLYEYSWLYNLRWFITHWWKKDHWVKTNLPIGYHDKPELIESSLFTLVEDYVSRDGEDGPSWVVLDEETISKISQILHFYRIDLPELQDKYDKLLHEIYKNFSMVSVDGKGLKIDHGDEYTETEISKMQNEANNIEQKIYEDTQKYLHMIIDIRMYLWS